MSMGCKTLDNPKLFLGCRTI